MAGRRPVSNGAGEQLLGTALDKARSWQPSRIYADGSLPAPGCYGVPDSWPHVRQLLVTAGFKGPDRWESALVARCRDLAGNRVEGAEARRSVGPLGARFDLVADRGHLGYIEVGEIDQALARSDTATTWTDVGNLVATEPNSFESVMPALMSVAADRLLLAGIERLIDYHADDIHSPEYLPILHRLGFVPPTTNQRGWTVHA